MEDVLEVYAEPYDPTRPKVNFDETTKQLLKETRQPLLAQPGRPQRYDYEYERNGTRNLFLFATIRCKAKSSQDTGVPGLRGAKHGFALNAPGA